MKNVIFDGENYYLFRALNDGNKKDLENGIDTIRTDCIRYYEEYGEWGKYSDKSKISLEEIYDHIKMRYRRDTNCISLTRDANVVLTYHNENPRYVLVKVSPEKIREIFDAGEYFSKVIEQQVLEAEKNVQADSEIAIILNQIDNATNIDEIKNILNKFNPLMSTYTVNNRQYLSDEEQIKIAKINAKLKVLENSGLIGNIIENIPNAQLLATMGNAYTSCEYIHYGDIPREITIDCPKVFIEIFSLLQQARENGVPSGEIDRINSKVLELILAGYDINERNNTFSNKENMISINEQDLEFLIRDYSSKQELKKDLSIDKAFELTGGKIGYNETNMQLMAIRSLSEMILKKRALVEILKKALPEEKELETILDNTYCINSELVIKQNGRGHQLSSTVNLLISEYGYDLNQEDTKLLLDNVSRLNTEELIEIFNDGIDAKGIKKLLISTRSKDQRIQMQKNNDDITKYIVEAIIEGYDWRKTRRLTKQEKDILGKRIATIDISSEQIKRLYNSLQKMVVGREKFAQDEIFAIIINIAIDGNLGGISYKELLQMAEGDMRNSLWENVEQLQTTVLPISIDLLMKRGKTINSLKKEFIELGISQEFIESKDVRNLYMARQIIEGYEFNTELSREDKKALVQCILKSSRLDNKQHHSNISTLINNLEKIGLNKQEVYGTIINAGVNGFALPNYSYTNLLGSSDNVRELKQYKDEIETTVSGITILKAKSDNLTEEEKRNLTEEFKSIGVAKEIIATRNVRNLYMAKQIVESYRGTNNLSIEDKKSLLQCILRNNYLTITKQVLLSTLAQNLEKIGLTEQEVYGTIINLGIKGNVLPYTGYDYSIMLSNNSKKLQEFKKHRREIETNVSSITILKAKSESLSYEQVYKLTQEMNELGIPREFIELKDIRNIYMAKQIVEGYNFEQELTNESKKALLYSILNKSALENNYESYLSSIMFKLEKIGLTEQEIYGAMINLAINNSVLQEQQHGGYGKMLVNPSRILDLKKSKAEIQTKVSKATIQKAKSESLNEEEVERLKQELRELGISKEFVEEKNIKNIYIAKQIIEGYQFDKELNAESKKALLYNVLNNQYLNKEQTSYLSTLMKNFEGIGLTEREIYGTIINLGINSNIVPIKGYDYTNLLTRSYKVKELKEHKQKIETKVTNITIQKAKSESLSEDEVSKLKQELEELGISKEFMEAKDIKNIYMAKQILEGYSFNQEINTETKRALLQCILNNSKLNGNRPRYLSTLMKNLESIGLTEQEIYGIIINLGVNGSILPYKGFDYTKLLSYPLKAQELAEYKDEIETKVSEETIRNAQEKSKKIMKKSVKQMKKQGNLEDIPSTMNELENMATMEFLKDNPSNTNDVPDDDEQEL